MTTELFLAVWRECEYCEGSGGSDLFDQRGAQVPCSHCNGWGKRPIEFIPLEELDVGIEDVSGFRVAKTPDIVTAISEWLERKEKETGNVENNNGVTGG